MDGLVFRWLLQGLRASAVALALGFGTAHGAPPAENAVHETLSLLGELVPSTAFASGAAVESLGFDQKAGFSRAVMGAVPLERLATLFGFAARNFSWSYQSGGYQQS